MAPLITLYILGGCVALSVVLFIVMIVVSAMRPPQLPDVSSFEPPLQRVIRALTPPFALPTSGFAAQARTVAPVPSIAPRPMSPVQMVPAPVPTIAPATRPPTPARLQMPTTPARPPAPPMPPAPPVVQRVAAPIVAAPNRAAPRVYAPTRSTPPSFAPSNRAASPVSSPSRPTPPSFAAAPARPALPGFAPRSAMPSFGAHIANRRPVYPVKRTRPLLRLAIALFMTATVAAGALVAYPAMLDVPCDELDWFGTDAALTVRAYAREARVEVADFIEQLQDTPAITAPQ